jgi:hypothetical protein
LPFQDSGAVHQLGIIFLNFLHAFCSLTPSKWQARQPINRGALESWRRYEPWLGPLAALIGYSKP